MTDKLSTVYARAILELALEGGKKQAHSVEEELQDLSKLLTADQASWAFFRSPLIDGEEKLQVTERALKGRVSDLVFHFMGVLVRRQRFDHFPEIVQGYSELLDREMGRMRVDVRTAVDLTSAQRDELKKALESHFRAPVIVTLKTKPDLIGGLVIRSGDISIDTSVRHNLARLREILLRQKILGEEFYEN